MVTNVSVVAVGVVCGGGLGDLKVGDSRRRWMHATGDCVRGLRGTCNQGRTGESYS